MKFTPLASVTSLPGETQSDGRPALFQELGLSKVCLSRSEQIDFSLPSQAPYSPGESRGRGKKVVESAVVNKSIVKQIE